MSARSHTGTIVVAIGGNALLRSGERVDAERARLESTCRGIARLASDGTRVLVTHGNGPQAGAALARSERAAPDIYPLPLDLCVASTQGEIGVLLVQALDAALTDEHVDRPVAAMLAQVVVGRDDPAFARPTKPIGAGAHRRLVASPRPIDIVEERAIHALLESGAVVVTLGGGGIPVVREGRHLIGVEAVVDKDLTSALAAGRLHAELLLFSTDVDRIYLDFGSARARGLERVTVEELQRHYAAGQFPPGSMGPKVDAAIGFVRAGGREAIVARYDQLSLALSGRAGTHVTV